MMYHTRKTLGQKESKVQKVTATEQKEYSLTTPPKINLRNDLLLDLRHSKAIAIINIQFRID